MMKGINVGYNNNVIVGIDTFDDAGVYRLTDDLAIIQTLDFFTPIVDDPYIYGQIAVCNALSDVYAMGGKPITAMNIVCFPTNKFTLDVCNNILKGGLDILNKAGVQLLGGHSVEDNEMKYGISVTGIIHPDKVIKNNGLKNGDVIILTKPLGTGIIGTAVKAEDADESTLNGFIQSMTTLNDKASEIMQKHGINACTDVTGFGLIGHLKEMLTDNLEIILDSKKLPILSGAIQHAAMGMIPGGMYKNRDFVGALCQIEDTVEQELADLIFDPQTSGGLLIAIEERKASDLLTELRSQGIKEANIIARVQETDSQKIRVL